MYNSRETSQSTRPLPVRLGASDGQGRVGVLLLLAAALLFSTSPTQADFGLGHPVNLGKPINSGTYDFGPEVSADGLELYLSSWRPGGQGGIDIWRATRATTEDDWGEPVSLDPPINAGHDSDTSISADGLLLFFCSDRSGNDDLWVSARATIQDNWGPPVKLDPPVNSPADESAPEISADGLTLWFSSNRAGGLGGSDIWVSTRATVNDPWQEPVNAGSLVNSPESDSHPTICQEGLTLLFSSERPGGYGHTDIWFTRRASAGDLWGKPVNLGPKVNDVELDVPGTFSADGARVYISATLYTPDSAGRSDIWQVPIVPILDFNGNGHVDLNDLLKMIACWGGNDPLCDIGPTPLGDGTVDMADLDVLMSGWGRTVDDPTLAAHWAFDESAGPFAQDSAGDNDAFVMGIPNWQPDAGVIDGALALDGTMTFLTCDFVLDPAARPFSVFAWIKGGAPGQVIVAQTTGANWLQTDPATGALMTELKASGASITPLRSQTVVTDGQWHRIGFVCDGTSRTLYVDDISVAQDTQAELEGCVQGLNIGCGANMTPGSFFNGLIDDLRIYDRAVKP